MAATFTVSGSNLTISFVYTGPTATIADIQMLKWIIAPAPVTQEATDGTS